MRDGQGPNEMVADWVKIFIAWMSQGRTLCHLQFTSMPSS